MKTGGLVWTPATGYEEMPTSVYWEWLTSAGKKKYRNQAVLSRPSERNPFTREPILTLSQGKYPEMHQTKSRVQIGNVVYNVASGRIERFVQPDTTEWAISPEVASRFLSVDPLTANYPELTPYQFASNTPIWAIDLDGLEAAYTTNPAGYLYQSWDETSGHPLPRDINTQEGATRYDLEIAETAATAAAYVALAVAPIEEFVLAGAGFVYIKTASLFGRTARIAKVERALTTVIREEKIASSVTKTTINEEKAISRIETSPSQTLVKPPCGCFTAGTLVLTQNGHKSIEEVKKGDLVWAYDEKSGKLALKPVMATFSYVRDSIYNIKVGEETITTTSDHPFFIGGKWLKVRNLQVGDSVTFYSGQKAAILNIYIVTGSHRVYNFTVDDFHTYYVSDKDVLVHNSGPCDFQPVKITQGTPNVKGAAKRIDEEIIEVAAGRGTERPLPYAGRENPTWAGSTEYSIPGLPNNFRILKQTKILTNGTESVRYGWSNDHYAEGTIYQFKNKTK